jgi:hypothetical protein
MKLPFGDNLAISPMHKAVEIQDAGFIGRSLMSSTREQRGLQSMSADEVKLTSVNGKASSSFDSEGLAIGRCHVVCVSAGIVSPL